MVDRCWLAGLAKVDRYLWICYDGLRSGIVALFWRSIGWSSGWFASCFSGREIDPCKVVWERLSSGHSGGRTAHTTDAVRR
jgi:rhodanese-related sulfurtransferase